MLMMLVFRFFVKELYVRIKDASKNLFERYKKKSSQNVSKICLYVFSNFL